MKQIFIALVFYWLIWLQKRLQLSLIHRIKIRGCKSEPGETFYSKTNLERCASAGKRKRNRKKANCNYAPKQNFGFNHWAISLKHWCEYLIIKGLHFKNGYSPKGHVITYRINNDNLANNCRVTEVVIEDFSQPDRFKGDSWVVFWGKIIAWIIQQW